MSSNLIYTENITIRGDCNFLMAGSGEKSLEISVRGFVILIDDEVSSIISSDLTRNYGSNPLSTSMFDANCIG